MANETGATAQRVREVMEMFGTRSDAALAELERLYAEDVAFQDPLQRLLGKAAVMGMNRRLVRRYKNLSFKIHEAVQSGDEIFLTWTMELPPMIGPTLRFDGSTHLRVRDGTIVLHRDYWDLLSGFMDSIPLAGAVYHAIASKFA